MTMFAGVAIVLAGAGLYRVVAFLLAQRTREIGIRVALGAKRASVTKMVLQQGLRPTVVGVVATAATLIPSRRGDPRRSNCGAQGRVGARGGGLLGRQHAAYPQLLMPGAF
jgi:hypothetical protein